MNICILRNQIEQNLPSLFEELEYLDEFDIDRNPLVVILSFFTEYVWDFEQYLPYGNFKSAHVDEIFEEFPEINALYDELDKEEKALLESAK